MGSALKACPRPFIKLASSEMALNGKQDEHEGGSHSAGGSEHRIDIPGSGDATTSGVTFAHLRSLQTQVEEAERLIRQVIHDTTPPGQSFRIQGKSLETLKQEEAGGVVSLGSVSAFQRVQNRLWIKQNTVYNEVLEDGERSLKIITERVDRREKRVEDLTNQVFNLVGFFSVFQGVILTAVTQLSTSVTTQLGGSSRPLCGKVWFPVVLSALAAVVTVVSVLLKFKHLYALDESIHEEKFYQRVPGFLTCYIHTELCCGWLKSIIRGVGFWHPLPYKWC